MKKILIVLIIVLLALDLPVVCAYQLWKSGVCNPEQMSKWEEADVIEWYCRHTFKLDPDEEPSEQLLKKIKVMHYYGEYHGMHAFAVAPYSGLQKVIPMNPRYRVAGKVFESQLTYEQIQLVSEKEMLYLKQAYENGVISKADVEEIHAKWLVMSYEDGSRKNPSECVQRQFFYRVLGEQEYSESDVVLYDVYAEAFPYLIGVVGVKDSAPTIEDVWVFVQGNSYTSATFYPLYDEKAENVVEAMGLSYEEVKQYYESFDFSSLAPQ